MPHTRTFAEADLYDGGDQYRRDMMALNDAPVLHRNECGELVPVPDQEAARKLFAGEEA